MAKITNFNKKELYTSYTDQAKRYGFGRRDGDTVLSTPTRCCTGTATLNSKEVFVSITYSNPLQKTTREDLKGTTILSNQEVSRQTIVEKFKSAVERFHKAFENLGILKGVDTSKYIKTDSDSKLKDLPEEIQAATLECMDSLI